MDTAKLEFLRGTLDVLILKVVAWGALHGYAITDFIRRQSDASRCRLRNSAKVLWSGCS
jgi:DNA-binding PadR family transcriptional regulator